MLSYSDPTHHRDHSGVVRTTIITHFPLSKSETNITIKSASLEVAVVVGRKTTFWLYSALLVIAQAATLERFGES